MNPSSGTYATFNTYLINNGGAPANFAANGQACVKPVNTRRTDLLHRERHQADRQLADRSGAQHGRDVGRQPQQLDLVGLVRRVLGVPGHLEDGSRRVRR